MKQTKSIALADWLLRHFTLRPHREALIGDLSEELQSGRSTSWYWRQVLSAIAVGILRSTRDYLFALIFSLAWCIFYPAWRLCLAKVSLAQIMSHRLATIDWPYSSALHGVGELLSALIFVWLGLFLYLILRVESASDFSALRLLASLSISLNILFVVMVGVRIHLKSVGTGLGDLGNAGLIANAHLFSITLPLTLSLFSAAVSVLPGSHGHGTAPLPG